MIKKLGVAAALAFAAVSVVVVTSVSPGHAATIAVNSTADGDIPALAGNGTCDLREAIESAQFDVAIDVCTAGSGADVITFNLGAGPHTITLNGTAGVLEINSDLTITGPGATQLAIDGNNSTRLFFIREGRTVTMSGLTIQNGYVPDSATNPSGAGIFLKGSLTANAIAVDSNQVGDDIPACFGCVGGGIHVHVGSSLTLTNSSVSRNVVGGNSQGGGISQDPESTMTLSNVTLSSNRTGTTGQGGGVHTMGAAEFNNVTITNNLANRGGGVYVASSGVLKIGNSIVEGNIVDGESPSGVDCGVTQQGVIDSQDYNLIGDLTGCTVSGTTTHNITGDAQLGSLQNNGGQTSTHALPDGSPAVDAADPASSCEATDQRGVARPIDGDAVAGAICDMGAYEKPVQQTEPTTTSTSTTTTQPITTSSGPAVSGPTAPPTTNRNGWAIPKTGPAGSGGTLGLGVAFLLGGAVLLLLIRRPRTN